MGVMRHAAVIVLLAGCGRLGFDPTTSGVEVATDAASTAGLALVQEEIHYVAATPAAAVTLPTTPIAGDVLVMIGATPDGALDAVTGGGAWTRAAASTTNKNVEIWYAIADGTSATVTASRAGNTADMWLAVSEWRGLATPVVLEGATDQAGVASPTSAGTLETHGPALVVFAATNIRLNTFGDPAPGTWTAMTGIYAGDMQEAWYQVAPTAGTFAPTATETGHQWDAALVGFSYVP